MQLHPFSQTILINLWILKIAKRGLFSSLMDINFQVWHEKKLFKLIADIIKQKVIFIVSNNFTVFLGLVNAVPSSFHALYHKEIDYIGLRTDSLINDQ